MVVRERIDSDIDDISDPVPRRNFPIQKRQLPKLSLKNLEVSAETFKAFSGIAIQFFIGMFLIWFGLTNTGSAFLQSTRFSGTLATIFYSWQVGTLLAIAGGIAMYDAFKKAGYV